MRSVIILVILSLSFFMTTSWTWAQGQEGQIKIARLKYSGGGDWYSDPTALPRLISFANERLGTRIASEEATVEPGSPEIFNYPFLFMTGHGNVKFSNQEARNLRKYMKSGGFLHIDDNYGMDQYIRTELKKVFPNKELVELPFDHPIYHQQYDFENGLPAVHKHDKDKPPQGFGIRHEGRLVLFYSYQSDLADGWEDPEVHNDPEKIRLQALRMGTNLIQYTFMGN